MSLKVGVWQTICVAEGLKSNLKAGFTCEWAIDEDGDPVEEMRAKPVDLLIAYRKNNGFGQRIQAILRLFPNTRVVATTSSAMHPAEAEYLIAELGVNSLVQLPRNQRDFPSFFKALENVALGYAIFERTIVSDEILTKLRRRQQIVTAPLRHQISLDERYSLVA